MNFLQKLNEILVKIGILQETLFFHDSVSTAKMNRFKEPRAHVETFNKQYNHEVS